MIFRVIIFVVITGSLRKFFSWVKVHKEFNSKPAAELYFERNFSRIDNWDRADAILMHVLKVPATQTVLVVGQLEIVKNQKEFQIDPKVSFQLL